MKRRNFLKISGLSPLYLKQFIYCTKTNTGKYTEPTDKQFAHLEFKGSYREIGYQIGRVFKKNIIDIINRRSEWHSRLITILKSKKGRSLSDKLLKISKKHFPGVIEEIQGIADGAGIHFDHIWAINIKSELTAIKNEPPGCSSIFVKNGNISNPDFLCHILNVPVIRNDCAIAFFCCSQHIYICAG